jgi:hypothetical protein
MYNNKRGGGSRGYGGQSKREFTPDPAIGYRFEYNNKDGDSREGVRIYIKQDLPAGTVLSGFSNDFKKKDTHPDFAFKVSDPKGGNKGGSRGGRGGFKGNARTQEQDDQDDQEETQATGDGYQF